METKPVLTADKLQRQSWRRQYRNDIQSTSCQFRALKRKAVPKPTSASFPKWLNSQIPLQMGLLPKPEGLCRILPFGSGPAWLLAEVEICRNKQRRYLLAQPLDQQQQHFHNLDVLKTTSTSSKSAHDTEESLTGNERAWWLVKVTATVINPCPPFPPVSISKETASSPRAWKLFQMFLVTRQFPKHCLLCPVLICS